MQDRSSITGGTFPDVNPLNNDPAAPQMQRYVVAWHVAGGIMCFTPSESVPIGSPLSPQQAAKHRRAIGRAMKATPPIEPVERLEKLGTWAGIAPHWTAGA